MESDSDATLVLVALGSSREPKTRAGPEAHAAAIRSLGRFRDARAAFLVGQPSLETVLNEIVGSPIVVLPLLMATDGFATDLLNRHLARRDLSIERLPPIGVAAGLVDFTIEVGESVCRSAGFEAEAAGLVLFGHGSRRDYDTADTVRAIQRAVAGRRRFAVVDSAFLDEAPDLPTAVGASAAADVAVIGMFATEGRHGLVDAPRLLGMAAGQWRRNSPDGRRVAYGGALGAAPGFADVILAHIDGSRSGRPTSPMARVAG
jgi:sirohydrochlorin ferrochelatase